MSTIVSARPKRDLKAEVAAIKRIADRLSYTRATRLAGFIFRQEFSWPNNIADAKIVRQGGRSFLSINSVLRRYRAQQKKAVSK